VNVQQKKVEPPKAPAVHKRKPPTPKISQPKNLSVRQQNDTETESEEEEVKSEIRASSQLSLLCSPVTKG
jgi:hypothetical protein